MSSTTTVHVEETKYCEQFNREILEELNKGMPILPESIHADTESRTSCITGTAGTIYKGFVVPDLPEDEEDAITATVNYYLNN